MLLMNADFHDAIFVIFVCSGISCFLWIGQINHLTKKLVFEFEQTSLILATEV